MGKRGLFQCQDGGTLLVEADDFFLTFLFHQQSFRSHFTKEAHRDGQQDSDHHACLVPGYHLVFQFPSSQPSLPTPSAPELLEHSNLTSPKHHAGKTGKQA